MNAEQWSKEIRSVADDSNIDADAFEIFLDWQGIVLFENEVDWDELVERFNYHYCGEFDHNEDFVVTCCEGMYDEIPSWVVRHIDWDDVWNCELRHDFFEEGGHYFRNF